MSCECRAQTKALFSLTRGFSTSLSGSSLGLRGSLFKTILLSSSYLEFHHFSGIRLLQIEHETGRVESTWFLFQFGLGERPWTSHHMCPEMKVRVATFYLVFRECGRIYEKRKGMQGKKKGPGLGLQRVWRHLLSFA